MGLKRVPPDDIPEVRDFMEADEVLQQFMRNRPEVFDTMRTLLEERNSKLQAADKVIRARGVVSGPWKVHSTKVVVDGAAMFEALGEAGFLAAGGTFTTVTQYTVDKAALDLAIAGNKVPAEKVDTFRTVSVSVSSPKEIKL